MVNGMGKLVFFLTAAMCLVLRARTGSDARRITRPTLARPDSRKPEQRYESCPNVGFKKDESNLPT